MGISAAVHLAALAAAVLVRPAPEPPRPPVYRVNIIAAPAGPRQIGVVRPPEADVAQPQPEPAAPRPTPPPPAPPVRARGGARTPPSNAPRAGGGPRGDRGTDVATVRTDGIEFPYPGYLNNIVRQIALTFTPSPGSSLRAEVAFTIRRDGSLGDVRVVRGSGDYEFDLEARGAVEAAAPRFGPLPAGFSDDALPVVFSFDPQFIR